MEYDNFMFDEAFDFHDRNLEELKAQARDYGEEIVKMDECRLPPLGACSSDIESSPSSLDADENARRLQVQHDQLNQSLLALTSHFAQVQFRLKQIIHGSKDDQDKLLTELEDFAFAGCPDVTGPCASKMGCSSCTSQSAIEQYESRIAAEKERSQRLDIHLKKMINELEITQKEVTRKKSWGRNRNSSPGYQKPKLKDFDSTYTFDPGEQLEVSSDEEEEIDGIPKEDLKQYIDTTMAKLINPKKAKEDVISQVTKQINDMEKFVTFLQGYESSADTDHENLKEIKVNNSKNTASVSNNNSSSKKQELKIPAPHTKMLKLGEEKRKRLHNTSIALMKKGMAVLQIFAISQFGCSAQHFREYMLRKSACATASSTGYLKPYETLRSSIDRIMMLHTKLVDVGGLTPDPDDELNLPISSTDKRASWSRTRQSSVTSFSGRHPPLTPKNSNGSVHEKPLPSCIQEDLIRLARGDFSTALKELIQHGLCQSFQPSKLSTKALVGCMSSHTVQGYGLHIWELFNKFYQLKKGDAFNTQPSNMLSEAFAMDVGCTQQTPKQSLLTVLYRIKTTHEPRKRSYDAMYKALVSAGLNRGRLAQWVRLVIRCPELVDKHFERWSYVIRSGFDEVLTALEKLSSMIFFLPEDLAIRHLLKNTNEFGDS